MPAGAGTGAFFQIDCNSTNLMCKIIMNVRVIWVFDYCFVQQLPLHHLHLFTQ